jgi:UDP-N-acetylglucosamine 2-epimerase
MSKNLVFILRKPITKDKKICFCNNSIIFPLDNYARLNLEEDNIAYATLSNYFDKNDYFTYVDELSNLVQECGEHGFNSDNQIALKEYLIYGDLSLWKLCQKHLADELFDNFFFSKIIRKIIDLERPQAIFILSSGKSDREEIIKSVAKKAGISLSIYSPGIFSRIEYWYNYSFNYFLTRPYPFIDLLKNLPDSFIIIERLQRSKEQLISFLQWNIRRAPSVNSSRKKILAISFANYHNFIKTTANVIREFNKDGLALIVRADVLTRDFKKFCRKQGVTFNSYYSYLSRTLDSRIKIILSVLLIRAQAVELSNLSQHIESRIGFPVKNTFRRFVNTHFSRYGLLRLIRFKLIVESILEKEGPGLIIIQEDRTKFGQIVAIEANKRKIPILVILQHISNYDSFWNLFLNIMPLADITAVTTDKVKNLLISRGMDGEKIITVGNPVYDAVLKNGFNFTPRENIYSRLKIARDKDILLFTSQPKPESDVLHQALIAIMEDFPDKHLVIKLHPLESGLRSILKSKRSKLQNITVIKDIDIWNLINCCSLLITVSSITAIDAMMLKKPVIIFGLNFDIGVTPFIEQKAVYFVDRYKDLPLAINTVLSDNILRKKLIENAEEFMQDNLGLHDGQANKRIVELANCLTSN